MGMVLRMAPAFLLAPRASLCAGLERFAQHGRLDDEVSCRDRARGRAKIGAVEAQSNAAREHLEIVLGQTGIGTGRAGLRTIVAGLDATDQRRVRFALKARMCADHFRCVHGALP